MSGSSVTGPGNPSLVPAPESPQGWQGWRNAQARWRLELERAQLARAASVRTAEAPRTPPQPAGEESRRERQPGATTSLRTPGMAWKEAAGSSRVFSLAVEETAMTASARPGEAAAGEAASPGASPARPVAPARSAPVALASRALFARPQWPAIHVHAAASGAGVQVSIRDASLGEARLREVAGRLRAHLRAAGQRLARLTVNGQEILSEEVDSCPSTR